MSLEAKLRVILTGYTVPMVTKFVQEMTIICSPVTGTSFDIVSIKGGDSGLMDSLKVLLFTQVYK